MFQLDIGDHWPLYEQIKEKMKFLIIDGMLHDGDRIPSVRELAVDMTINPNTVARAYRELESEGFIYSQKAKGYFVAPRDHTEKGAHDELFARFTDAARELMYRGTTCEALCGVVYDLYKGGSENGNDKREERNENL